MYETGGDLCPVKSYQLYLMKLHPLQPRLFQQPRRKATPDSPMWYGKAPIGEKALQQMMANISGIYCIQWLIITSHTNGCKNHCGDHVPLLFGAMICLAHCSWGLDWFHQLRFTFRRWTISPSPESSQPIVQCIVSSIIFLISNDHSHFHPFSSNQFDFILATQCQHVCIRVNSSNVELYNWTSI